MTHSTAPNLDFAVKPPRSSDGVLITFAAAARVLEVYQHTIGDLVRAWGIVPKPMSNGRAKGLDRDDMDVLRRALNLPACSRKRAGKE